MKKALAVLAIALSPTLVLAAGTHSGGHGHNETKPAAGHGHSDNDAHGHQDGMAVGKPAEANPTRTIKVVMKEDYEGDCAHTCSRRSDKCLTTLDICGQLRSSH